MLDPLRVLQATVLDEAAPLEEWRRVGVEI